MAGPRNLPGMPSGLPRDSSSYVAQLTHSTQPTHSTTRLTRPAVHSEKTTARPSNSRDCIHSLNPRTPPHPDANPREVSQWFVQNVRDRPFTARVLHRPSPLKLCIRSSMPLPKHSTQHPTNKTKTQKCTAVAYPEPYFGDTREARRMQNDKTSLDDCPLPA